MPVSVPARFDFGGGPAEAGFTKVAATATYSAAAGYGWTKAPNGQVDRGGTARLMHRDICFGADFTYRVDLPDGTYDVTAHIGDLGAYEHEGQEVHLDGVLRDTVTTYAQVVGRTYRNVAVSGGFLTVRMRDATGPDPNACLAGLEIALSPAKPRAAHPNRSRDPRRSR